MLLLPSSSSLLDHLLPTSTNNTLTLVQLHPPSLIAHLANEYLVNPPPSGSSDTDGARFWGILNVSDGKLSFFLISFRHHSVKENRQLIIFSYPRTRNLRMGRRPSRRLKRQRPRPRRRPQTGRHIRRTNRRNPRLDESLRIGRRGTGACEKVAGRSREGDESVA